MEVQLRHDRSGQWLIRFIDFTSRSAGARRDDPRTYGCRWYDQAPQSATRTVKGHCSTAASAKISGGHCGGAQIRLRLAHRLNDLRHDTTVHSDANDPLPD